MAVLGLLANIAAFALLRAGARESINLQGAYLEVLGDLLGSVGVIGAALLITVTDWWWADPLVAVAIGVFILPRTWRLARAAVRILVQAAPEHLQVTAVHDRLAAVPGVVEVHDLHVWTLTSGMEVASAHLTMAPARRSARCSPRRVRPCTTTSASSTRHCRSSPAPPPGVWLHRMVTGLLRGTLLDFQR